MAMGANIPMQLPVVCKQWEGRTTHPPTQLSAICKWEGRLTYAPSWLSVLCRQWETKAYTRTHLVIGVLLWNRGCRSVAVLVCEGRLF